MSASLPYIVLVNYTEIRNRFVETGSLHGETIETAIAAGFKSILSVELDPNNAALCEEKFKEFKHVSISCSDSVSFLQTIIPLIDSPTVFFLDAHADCDVARAPIIEEINEISKCPFEIVIFADDMNYMGIGKWPTREEIFDTLRRNSFAFKIIGNDRFSDSLLVAWRK